MIDLYDVGAHPFQDTLGRWQVKLGIYLPNITYPKGYSLKVRIIHEKDQFIRGIEPKDYYLNWINDTALDLWQVMVPLVMDPSNHFGQAGTYLYRFQLLRHNQEITFWFADPFGRAAGLGALSAFEIDSPLEEFAWQDAAFEVPEIDQMIIYELNVREFNRDFSGVVDQLDYLQGMGVNVLELMPITNVKEDVEWGYTPLSYFAPDDRLGGVKGMKHLVNACHKRGIAVILDAVYAHAHPEFAYNLVYDTSGEPNPLMGAFAGEFFEGRPGTDYSKTFTRDYFFEVNQYWLHEYHIDGFRYDYVPGMYDGATGQGYANLVFRTYHASKIHRRFEGGNGRSKIIQCAEHLPDAAGIMRQTYSNCAWQNGLLDRARDMAKWHYVAARFAQQLDPEFLGYPTTFHNPATGDSFPVAPLQYIESHDHSRFINEFGRLPQRDLLGEFYGDRSRFFKMQPFIIALLTAKGIPMIWNGQEFGENWGVPHWGIGRNLFERAIHWEYFYDAAGKALLRLHRILGSLRRNHRALGSRGYFYYYHDQNHLAQGVIAFRREDTTTGECFMIFLNFFDWNAKIEQAFPHPGIWLEKIDGTTAPTIITENNQTIFITIPSNYGSIYLLS